MDTATAERIEGELRAIRRMFEGAGLRLRPTAVCIQEAARLLSCSAKHVSRMIRRGQLRVSMVGGLKRISVAEIERLLEECRQECAGQPQATGRRTARAEADEMRASLRRR